MTAQDYLTLTKRKLNCRIYRLNNLYYIKDIEGKKIKFKLNWAQDDLYSSMWYINVILKARQLGFSTFICIYMLDAALFNKNHKCGIIDHSISDAKKKLEKIKFAYEYLPEWIKEIAAPVKWGSEEISFSNGSSVIVGTSHRGDTLQKLHISELGKIAAKFPEKAKEIKSGALNAIHAGQQVFIESTAEGQGGLFYDICQIAEQLQQEGVELTDLDPKFFFFPWWQHPDYKFSDEQAKNVIITPDDQRYFDELKGKGISLTDNQKAWYVKKSMQQGDDMLKEFPSTSKEAFEAAIEGAYFSRQLSILRKSGAITQVPFNPAYPVHTSWDLGRNDFNTIWFYQHIGTGYNFINYYENHGEAIGHYGNYLRELEHSLGYKYGTHHLPHDGKNEYIVVDGKVYEHLQKTGVSGDIDIVRRAVGADELKNDIETTRTFLLMCRFDKEKCAKGLGHLGSYRKEWNDTLGTYRDRPRHDAASHGADGFRTAAVGSDIEEQGYELNMKKDGYRGRITDRYESGSWTEF